MRINKLTITGADDKTNHEDLVRLSKEYSFIEWGILFSKSKEGEQRYPTREWIAQVALLNLDLSAHFCGWWAKEIVEEGNFYLITILPESFKRIQINYNFKNSKKWKLEPLIEYAIANPSRSIILQYNKSNAPYLDALEGLPFNINFLYDSSGGRGTTIQSIGHPILGKYTGYSGGLTPDNIVEVASQIEAVQVNTFVWMDLETGARTENELDIAKCTDIGEKMKSKVG